MKKSILPLVVACMLFPQLLVSQYSAALDNFFPLQEELNSYVDEVKNKITTLKSFELVNRTDNSMKVVASFIQSETFEVRVFNNNGLTVFQETFETDEINLAMGFSQLPDGNYYVSLSTAEGEVIKPFR